MKVYNREEIQKCIKKYTINVSSGDVIELTEIIKENVFENKDNIIEIKLSSATYNHRLYEIFKNKELITSIDKLAEYVSILTGKENVDRNFTYDNYFRIVDFNTFSRDKNDIPYYDITFQSV